MSSLLIVESPSKCKTLEKYLGKDYRVLASYGHIRSLVKKDGSVETDNSFAMKYEISGKQTNVKALVDAAKVADKIYLATDPDREGEAISWHVWEILKEKKAIKSQEVKRISFNQITKNAVLDALKAPRDVDWNLVAAQESRLALDYLVGFTLSPILWSKLKGCKSAGRVQSVALRLICVRENEIEAFNKEEYWSIEAVFSNPTGQFSANLIGYKDAKIEKNITNETQATEIVEFLKNSAFKVVNVEVKDTARNPYAPFSTSTLQQDASSKLGFGAKKTMTVAQGLYEAGYITYMRTDSPTISNEGIAQIRGFIEKKLGKPLLSPSVRVYTSKQKNAQEAHEAIRPTDVANTPDALRSKLKDEDFKLYELIWKRAVASQCSAAAFEATKIDIEDLKHVSTLRANGNVLKFKGFLEIYDYNESDDKTLPQIENGQNLDLKDIKPEQHFTQPPPRFNEASLVKQLEELGIGRPSTYANIISILQDREYVRMDKKRFIPEKNGRVLVAFLEEFFKKYVEYDFTAQLEEQLDYISNGDLDKLKFLSGFWGGFHGNIEEVKQKPNPDIMNALEGRLENIMFMRDEEGKLVKTCPKCSSELKVKTGKFGPFVACSNYPTCNYIQKAEEGASTETEGEGGEKPKFENISIGINDNGNEIYLKKGPYGPYLEVSKETDSKGKPKRVSISKPFTVADITPGLAKTLISLPKVIGKHPKTGEEVSVGIGKYGPYVLHNKKFHKLDSAKLLDPSLINLDEY
jgi:DNA topoisomerase-1